MELDYFQSIKKNSFTKIKPVYLIEGDEDYLKEKIFKKIISSIAEEQIDFEQVEAEDIIPERLFNSLNTLPFISQKRILVIKNAQRINKEIEKILIEYLKNPNYYTCLILITQRNVDDEKPVKFSSQEIRNIIKNKGDIIKCKFNPDTGFTEFINSYLTEHGKKIESSAQHYFFTLSGSGKDLYNITSELEKLITYIGDKITISKEDVEKVVTQYPETIIFNLIDAVSNKSLGKALNYLEGLLKKKERPEKILAMIARQFRFIWQAKFLIKEGYLSDTDNYYKIQQEIKMVPDEVKDKMLQDKKDGLLFQYPSIISKIVKQSFNFDYERLAEIINRLLAADLSIKDIKGGQDDKTVLELLILDLCK